MLIMTARIKANIKPHFLIMWSELMRVFKYIQVLLYFLQAFRLLLYM